MAEVELTLLGGFRVRAAERSVDIPARKTKALLAYLSLQPSQEFQRDKLAALLWEESSDAQARQSLRQALSELRKVLPSASLHATTDTVTLDAGYVDTDVRIFQELAESEDTAEREHALSLYGGEFLEGFNPRSAAFEDWLMNQRSRLRESAMELMRRMLHDYQSQQKTERAIQVALRILATDTLQESVHRTLMQLYAQQGRHAEALKQYRACQGVLQRELGVEPEVETQQLYKSLRDARRQPIASKAAAETVEADRQSGPVTQLRQVTLCYAQWILPEASLESATVQRQQFYQFATECLQKYGGELTQKLNDAVIVSFGIPRAHSNDSERALRNAMCLMQRLPAQVAIGIASGQVVTSSDELITGDALNIARDLAMSAGVGAVMLSDEVYQAVRQLVAVRSDGPRHKVIEWSQAETLGPLVGRRAECAQFTAALELCVEAGHGQIFLIRGDAGIGKTRLLQEFARIAGERGFESRRVLILDFGGGAGYDPMRELLRGICLPGSENWARLMQQYAGDVHETMFAYDLVNEALPATQQAVYDALDSSVRENGRRRAMRRILAHAAHEHSLLLQVEDIHWGSKATLDMLAALAAMIADHPAILVMTSRVEGEALDPEWRSDMQGAALTTIDLGPLRGQEALELAQQFELEDEAQVRRCIDRAGGNPLFLEQLLLAGGETIPDSIQALVWARMDQLHGRDRQALQAASVMGQRFDLAALRFLIEDDQYECNELIAQRLVRREGQGLLFAHALVMEGVYTSLLQTQREKLHLRAADWFRDHDLASCAEQLDRAGRGREAAGFYLAAARQRMEQFQYARAAELAGRGVDLSSDVDERLELLHVCGESHLAAGETGQSLAAYQRAAELALDDTAKVRAALGQASVYRLLDQHEQVLLVLQRAEELAQRQQDDAALAQVFLQWGNALFPLGRVDECLRAQEKALAHAQRTGSGMLRARALGGVADAYYQRGHMLTAERFFGQCVKLARDEAYLHIEPGNLAMRGITQFYQCRIKQCLADANAALELAVKIGSKRDEIVAANIIGLVELLCGNYANAVVYTERALTIAREVGARRFEAELLSQSALLREELGEHQLACAMIVQAEAMAEQVSPEYMLAWVLAIKAYILDDPRVSADLLAEGEVQLQQGAVSHNYLHFCEVAIDVSHRLNDAEGLKHYADMLRRYTQDEPLPWAELMIERAQMLVDHHKGMTDRRALSALRDKILACGLGRAAQVVSQLLGAAPGE